MLESVFKQPNLKVVASDILQIDFIDENYCPFIVAACEELNSWAGNKKDRHYATQDIHFNQELPDLYTMLTDQLNNVVWDVVAEYWGIDSFSVSDLFALKYSMDKQVSLPLHHDESYITGSVKLNSDYAGAELLFPRQDFSNADVPVGSLLVFPGRITHPHMCKNLKTGNKYSLTIWTKDELPNSR